MKMNFLDLSSASEDERRLIREILSDTSVVNFVQPTNNETNSQSTLQSSPTDPLTATYSNAPTLPNKKSFNNKPKKDSENNFASLANDSKDSTSSNVRTSSNKPRLQNHVATNNLMETNNSVPHVHQPVAHHHNPQHIDQSQQPIQAATIQQPIAGDINSVIGMDMTGQRPPYTMRQQVPAAFPTPVHMYSGPPLFQPIHYLMSYQHPYAVPYVLPATNPTVVQQRLVSPQATQSANTSNSTSSHHRSHSNHLPHHQRGHRQYSNSSQSVNHHHHYHHQEHKSHTNNTNFNHNHTNQSHNIQNVKDTSISITPSQYKNLRSNNNDNTNELVVKDSTDTNIQAPDLSQNSFSEKVAVSSDEGFETPSSLDASKQSHEIPVQTSNDNDCNTTKSEDQKSISNDIKSGNGDFVANLGKNTNNTVKDDHVSEDTNMNTNIPNAKEEENNTTVDSGSEQKQTSSTSSGSASSKSWAGLFKRSQLNGVLVSTETNDDLQSNHKNGIDNKVTKAGDSDAKHNNTNNHVDNMGRVTNVTSEELKTREAARRALDKMAPKLAQKISSINLKHSLPFLKPRGFINKGNGCYINATLQALIACPPFYNLMKEIGDLKCTKRDNSCTPILDSFSELFSHFPPLDSSKKMKQNNVSPPDPKLNIQSLQAESIEPKCIYNVLGNIKSECLKGAQEDVEEFLSSLLNGLHDEMISLRELNQTNTNGVNGDQQDSGDELNINDDNNVWRDVGHKNRSLPVRSAKAINTPISDIFGGWSFSLRTAGKDRCGHRSPFFDLQLDISSDNVKSLQDAIKSFTAPEIIHDFYCSKTKQKLDAQRRTSLDQLPPILILHLKQFVYTADHGLKKLMKKIEYPIDFELPESCLYERSFSDKSLKTSRTYKLLAVVYHDGKEAIKGHYLTDVYHIGSSQWIRCDDSNLKVVPSPRIEGPDSSKTPYLLFYRRLNTLGRAQQPNNNHDNHISGSKRKS